MTGDASPDDTIGALRAEFFRAGGFGLDGGASARWVRYPVLGIPIVVPNVESRRRALPLHDLHHLATGYDTSWTGEAEIAAWELAAGCHTYAAAWVLNFSAFTIGLVIAPRRLWRAFVRGRSAATLYRHHWRNEYLDWRLRDLRDFLGLVAAPRAAGLGDVLRFAACALPGLAIVAGFVALVRALV